MLDLCKTPTSCVSLVLLLQACASVGHYTGPRPGRCEAVGRPLVVGVVSDPELEEVSGAAASRKNPKVLWVIEDSGGPATVVALAADGGTLGRYALAGARNHDWEDIAVAAGADGESYLYAADIGDNWRLRPSVSVYRVKEPVAEEGEHMLDGVERLELVYPFSQPHDAETLLVDPATGDLALVTRDRGGQSKVFLATAPLGPGRHELSQIALVTFAGDEALSRLPSAGGISADGATIAIRTYTHVYLWNRPRGASLASALAVAPCISPLASEPQGEAFSFAPDGTGFFTLSEKRQQPIYFYPLTIEQAPLTAASFLHRPRSSR